MQEGPRRLNLWQRTGVRVISSRPGAWFFSKVMHRIDRPLLRLTRGKVSIGAGFPVLLLTTTGAKSGRPRTVPLLYLEHDGGLAVIASRFGFKSNPGWYHNLRADPEATVEQRGERRTYFAREATDEERASIWPRAVAVYPGYDAYAARAGRRIPIFVLTPKL